MMANKLSPGSMISILIAPPAAKDAREPKRAAAGSRPLVSGRVDIIEHRRPVRPPARLRAVGILLPESPR